MTLPLEERTVCAHGVTEIKTRQLFKSLMHSTQIT